MKCGLLEESFLRVRCAGCHAERLVAFSRKKCGVWYDFDASWKAAISQRCKAHPTTFPPADSNRNSRAGDEVAEACGVSDPAGDWASGQTSTRANAEPARKRATWHRNRRKRERRRPRSLGSGRSGTRRSHRVRGGEMCAQEHRSDTGIPRRRSPVWAISRDELSDPAADTSVWPAGGAVRAVPERLSRRVGPSVAGRLAKRPGSAASDIPATIRSRISCSSSAGRRPSSIAIVHGLRCVDLRTMVHVDWFKNRGLRAPIRRVPANRWKQARSECITVAIRLAPWRPGATVGACGVPGATQ